MVSLNCHITSGFSGLPKLRQFVAAMGRAPLAATLRAASATACIAPTRGFNWHQRPLPSVESARARFTAPVCGSLMRTTAASLAALFGDQEHALLRFAEHDFVRRHTGFTLGNFGEIDFDAGAAARGHFHGGAGEAGSAHVLNRDDCAGLHGFETGFEEQFLHERVADLHVGALLLGLLGEFGGGEERCAVNSVTAGFCADVNHGIADAFGFGEKDLFFFGDAEGERVDERVLRIARLESDFAADSRNAETISVTADAANDAIEDAAGGGKFIT